jgi:hypothetical protein
MIAAASGKHVNGVGKVLAGLERSGEVKVGDYNGTPVYRLK